MFTALLDTCVLWPSTQRDFLLSLAFEGAYRFILSEAILSELEVHEELKHIDRGTDREDARANALHLVREMRASFADSIVLGWENLEGTYGLPDADDEHVLAAAVVSGARSIVTENVRDFPQDKLPPGIHIVSAKIFAHDTVSMHPQRAVAAVENMAARTGRKGTRLTPNDILDVLDRQYDMSEATEIIRSILNT